MSDGDYITLKLNDYNLNQFIDLCPDLPVFNNSNKKSSKQYTQQHTSGSAYISSYHTPTSLDEGGSPEQLSSDAFNTQNNFLDAQSKNNMDNASDFFTPALSTITTFHERKGSELSNFTSPTLNMDPFFDGTQHDLTSHQSSIRQENSAFSMSNNSLNSTNSNTNSNSNDIFNLFFEKPTPGSFQNLGTNSNNQNIKNMDLSSLGIELKPTSNTNVNVTRIEDASKDGDGLNIQDMSFNINESFIEKLIKPDEVLANSNNESNSSVAISNDVLTYNFLNNINSQQIGQQSNQKSQNIRSPPKSLSKKKSILKKFLEDEMMDEGDTTIINNTTIIEPGSAVKQVSSSDFMNDLKTHESSSSNNISSSQSSEAPRLRSFYPKSPTLGYSNKVTKPSNLNDGYKNIPVLNENLAFFEAQYSPTKQTFNDNSTNMAYMLSSPTRNDFATSSSVSSSPVKDIPIFIPGQQHQTVMMPPMLQQSPRQAQNTPSQLPYIVHGGSMIPVLQGISMIPPTQVLSPPMNSPYCFSDESPPTSPMLHSSPTSSPSKFNVQNGDLKKPFILKPTANARKRVATSPRSKTGCWTCRIRHKKCDECKPVCNNCAKINLKCDQFYNPKPDYMKNSEAKKAKLAEIAEIWKNRTKKKSDDDPDSGNITQKKKSENNDLTPLGKSNKSLNISRKNIISGSLEMDKENFGLTN